MHISVKKNREIAVQLVYSLNSSKNFIDESLFIFMSIFQVSRKNMVAFVAYAQEIYAKRSIVDAHLENVSKEYSIDRIGKVDLSILRVLLYEIIEKNLPVEIAISEAIRLAKKFSSYGSEKYLHAIIDSVYKEIANAEKSNA